MIKVFLAGEGPCELGSRSGHPSYQSDANPGALQSLLRAVRGDGWQVVGAVCWKDIRKLRVNAAGEGDARNMKGAALQAVENGADVLAFTRDRDRDAAREAVIERAIVETSTSSQLKVAGGIAVETLEGWLLAIGGKSGSEAVRHPEKSVAELGLAAKSTADYVAHIEKHGLARIPADAQSIRLWVERASDALETEPQDTASSP